MGAASLSPALLRLIQAIAEDAAREDYLAVQASTSTVNDNGRTKPVPLPATDRAA